MLATSPLCCTRRATLRAGRIDALPNLRQETVRLKAASADRVEVEGLLVHLDFFLQADLRDWNKWRASIAHLLDLDAEDGMTCHSTRESIFPGRAVLRQARRLHIRHETNPNVALSIVNSV